MSTPNPGLGTVDGRSATVISSRHNIAASAGPRRRRRPPPHVPGEPGLWILLFGDLSAFAILFALYLHQRGQQRELFAASQATLNRSLAATNTLVLLASSLLVAMATAALRSTESRRLARPLLLGAMVCGVVFIAIKIVEYHEKLAFGLTPGTNDFYMYYFVLTGIHLAHLVFGLAALFVLWKLARATTLTPSHRKFFEAGACFWHMVDMLWIVIFALLFLVR
jgi:nitric oxide reductase NorE protein